MEKKGDSIYVTRPFLPDLNEYLPFLKQIWDNHILTNNGPFHQKLESELCNYLGVKHVSLFSNGTLALMTALQALRIVGEVITTPYSFVASTHALHWNNIKPVFVDIERETCNIDPHSIEAAISPRTTAIVPVHVYGQPCNVEEIQKIAQTYNLKVIYDAAHAFGVKKNGNSILNFGDLSVLSFHATKVYNTFEGGAIISHTPQMKQHIDDLKNFGFRDEVTVVAPGINAKMNEIQAAMGLLQLKYIDSLIEKRKVLTEIYLNRLMPIMGLSFNTTASDVQYNYSYFPVFIDEHIFGRSRDQLYLLLKENNIYARRYFYPLISQFSTYRGLESALPGKMPVAERVASQVLCLPLYADMTTEEVDNICNLIMA